MHACIGLPYWWISNVEISDVEIQWSPYKTCNAHLEGGQHFVGLTLKSHNNSHIHIKFSFVRLESARSATFETRTFNCTKCMFHWRKNCPTIFLSYVNAFLASRRGQSQSMVGCIVNVMCLPCHWWNIYLAREQHSAEKGNTNRSIQMVYCPRKTYNRKKTYKILTNQYSLLSKRKGKLPNFKGHQYNLF